MIHPVAKAIWFIESHFARPISLAEIANASGMSRHHLSRRFGEITGQPLSHYLRGRRLTEAARQLAAGAPDILRVALDAGYNSHEAFTRAFRDRFGATPESVRARRDLSSLNLQEPLRMTSSNQPLLPEPRIETLGQLTIVGLARDFDYGQNGAIPALWQDLNQYFGNIPGQVDNTAYGLCHTEPDMKNRFRYMAGVRVAPDADVPKELKRVVVPAQRYAIFPHHGHVNAIAATAEAAFTGWLPASGYTAASFPELLEFYGEDFDPESGTGRIEIWIPLAD